MEQTFDEQLVHGRCQRSQQMYVLCQNKGVNVWSNVH